MERVIQPLLIQSAKSYLGLSTTLTRRRLEASLESPKLAQEATLRKIAKVKSQTPRFYEFTTGTTGPRKKIPYTPALVADLTEMFQLWAWDILNNLSLRFHSGKFYMAVSPKIGVSLSDTSHEDSEFVSPFTEFMIHRFLPVQTHNKSFSSGDQFFRYVAHSLLKQRDLEALSLWSPGAFLSLMSFIEERADEFQFSGDWQSTWPHLKFISCWTSAQAHSLAQVLQSKFPQALVQGKGLLATEGPMTMPWTRAKGAIPLLNHTYFEFKNDQRHDLKLHELKEGEVYEILPSFANGLTRCDLGDQVKVTHFYKNTPVLEFVGRATESSDLAGEKLSGPLLRELMTSKSLHHYVFFPTENSYKVFWSGNTQSQNSNEAVNEEYFESRLRKSFHYNLARELKQLNKVSAQFVPHLENHLRDYYIRAGQVSGQIKEFNLSTDRKLKKYLESI